MADDKTAGLRRRVYKDVAVSDANGGYGVALDGRPVKTPDAQALAVATRDLAQTIADEWAAQDEHIRPHTMPLTQIACTAVDRIGRERTAISDGVARYAETDLVCYRAEAPADLVERQLAAWQPPLDWLARELGAELVVTTGILPAVQSDASLGAVRDAVDAFDDHELAVLSVLTQATASVVIALAVVHCTMDADAAIEAAQLDERYQSELWGMDREAEQRLQTLACDMRAACLYLDLHRR